MPTLSALLHATQERLGAFTTVTTGYPSTGSSYVGVSTAADANKWIVSADLARQDYEGTAANVRIDTFDGAWALAEGSSEQRRLVPSGWVSNAVSSNIMLPPSSHVVGYLVTDRAFSTALAANQTVSLYPTLPPLQASDWRPSLRSCINRALASQRMVWRHTFSSTTANTYRFNLSAMTSSASSVGDLTGWLTQQVQIGGVYSDLSSAQTYLEPYAFGGGGEIRWDGGTPYLVLQQAVGTGTSIYADFLRPRDSWIKAQGSTAYANSTAGLVALGDEATGPLKLTAAMAAYHACDKLARSDPTGTRAVWAEERDRLAVIVGPSLIYQQPEPIGERYSGHGDSPMFRRRRPGGRARRWP